MQIVEFKYIIEIFEKDQYKINDIFFFLKIIF